MRTDREELEILRTSVARIAQAAGVQTDKFPVLDQGFGELCKMAKEDRGWNALSGLIVQTLTDHVHFHKTEASDVVEALRVFARREETDPRTVSYAEYLTKLADDTEAKIK